MGGGREWRAGGKWGGGGGACLLCPEGDGQRVCLHRSERFGNMTSPIGIKASNVTGAVCISLTPSASTGSR